MQLISCQFLGLPQCNQSASCQFVEVLQHSWSAVSFWLTTVQLVSSQLAQHTSLHGWRQSAHRLSCQSDLLALCPLHNPPQVAVASQVVRPKVTATKQSCQTAAIPTKESCQATATLRKAIMSDYCHSYKAIMLDYCHCNKAIPSDYCHLTKKTITSDNCQVMLTATRNQVRTQIACHHNKAMSDYHDCNNWGGGLLLFCLSFYCV